MVAAVTRLYQHVSLSDFAESMFASDLAGMVNAQWWFLPPGDATTTLPGWRPLGGTTRRACPCGPGR